MSLAPLIFSDWWDSLEGPHHIFDQHFGLPLDQEDFIDRIAPSRSEVLIYKPSKLHNRLRRYHPFLHGLARRSGKGSSVVSAKDNEFCINLDVNQFSPEEVNVKVVDNHIVVEAKHEEKEDEHGWISRQFTRKYLVPNQCDIDQVESRLSSDGVLTITAPKKQEQKLESNERIIKIQHTGEPAIAQSEASTSGENAQPKEGNQPRQVPQRGKKSTVKAA
ncbi:protein lethal(2)essential for life [Copidosoma floridanum]|uniref:protein lethal(2)essential for life n=1 Tax=Copidosoma floridanum TaxID=29053 RepID=UPI0006C95F3B|nr:protein lethal(2)essential for life [Copidosoma floridanum]